MGAIVSRSETYILIYSLKCKELQKLLKKSTISNKRTQKTIYIDVIQKNHFNEK